MLLAIGRSLRRSLLAPAQQGLRPFAHNAAHHDDDDHSGPMYLETPTVFDRIIKLNVYDMMGKRHIVQGLTGETLSKTLIDAGFPASYFFPNMGFYTQHIVDAHVFIPKDYWPLIPNFKNDSDEADAIKRTFRDIIQECARDTSYLASYIKLKPEMNNMTVGIGPIKPWHLHPHWCFAGVHEDPTPQFERKTVEIFG